MKSVCFLDGTEQGTTVRHVLSNYETELYSLVSCITIVAYALHDLFFLGHRIEMLSRLEKETLGLATQGGILNGFLSNSMFYHRKSNTCSYWSAGE